jgi:hypothetical protein
MLNKFSSYVRIIAISVSFITVCSISLNAPAVAASEAVSVQTEFYTLGISSALGDRQYSWVTKYQGEKALVLSSDTGMLQASHVVEVLDSENSSFSPVGNFTYPGDIGDSFRTLDFVNDEQNKDISKLSFYVVVATGTQDQKCRRVQVLKFSSNVKDFAPENPLAMSRVFATKCIPASTTGAYAMHQSGGRLVQIPKNEWRGKTPEFFLSTGDFANIELNAPGSLDVIKSQVGKILRIANNSSKVVASGLRNPQGLALLAFDNKHLLFESEHGPRGGDELNLITKGNFGWPRSTYGTNYVKGGADLSPISEGTLGSSQAPLFAWVPSVAPSQLIQVKGKEFERWWQRSGTKGSDGDILMATLAGKSIQRIRFEKGSVRYVESIPIGERLRSLSQTDSGLVLAGTDSGKVLVIRASSTWDTALADFN